MNTKKKNKTWKLPKYVFYFFFLCIFLLYIQFAYLSLSKTVYGKNMDDFAATRNTVKKTLKATRGRIYDSSQNVLALNVSSYTVIAHLEPSKKYMGDNYIPNDQTDIVSEALAPVLEVEVDYLKSLFEKGKQNGSYQIEFGRAGKGITELKKEEIENLGIVGITFTESQKRYYPNGDFASYIIGYAKDKEVIEEDDSGNQNTVVEIVGELGIESKYDELLKGTDGYLEYQRDRYGYKIAGTKEKSVESIDGYDIYLTLDANIQRFVETAVKEADSTYHPEWLQIAVMDAKTGDILGFASTPSFDPNIRDIVNYENPLVSSAFEPGSTMKTYTYMCAIENGKYNGSDTFLSGQYTIGEDVISDWNNTGWGEITYDKGYEYSSNVGVANLIENSLSKKELKDCFKKYGFGDLTDIELSREQAGLLNFNYPIEVATAGFGQGITTTAIQQLQALTLISNNGKMLKPHIVEKIVDPNTSEIYYERTKEESEQLIKTSTVEKMKELMDNTVRGNDPNASTGYPYRIDGFDVIGKTGTSQIFDNATGSYLTGDNAYIFSFAGMYPKDDPEIIIYAAMKQPTWGKSGGLSTATKDVMKSIAKYKNMFNETENNVEEKSYIVTSYQNKKTDIVQKELEENGIKTVFIGTGDKVINQSISAGTTLVAGDMIILVTNSNEYKMPNMKGWSRKNVVSFLEMMEIPYQIDGYGFVVNQSIEKGTIITKDMITITLESKLKEESS